MAVNKYLKGQALFALARRKASAMGIEYTGMKLEELVREIQSGEGNTPCFRLQETCSEVKCCWQASCGAVMGTDG